MPVRTIVNHLRKTPLKKYVIRLGLDDYVEDYFLPRKTHLRINGQEVDYWLYRLGTYLRWSRLDESSDFWSEAGYSRLFAKVCKNCEVVYDIGADHGYYSVLAGTVLDGGGMIRAFEPHPVNHKSVDKNTSVNSLPPKINTHRVAFNADGSETELGRKHPAIGEGETVTVPGSTLDDFANSHADGVDLLKIDVEGAESIVLDGGKNLIECDKPKVLIEMHERGEVRRIGGSWDSIYGLLNNNDYWMAHIGWHTNKITTGIKKPPNNEKHFLVAFPNRTSLPIEKSALESVSNDI